MIEEKIKTLDELVAIRKELKEKNKVVVTTNGSYDILHAGHVRSLEEARGQGDVLIVGLNSDQSVKGYKSTDRPIIPEKERAEVLAGLESVDYVFLFDELNPIAFINKLKPDVHADGEEYKEDCIEADAVKENGGKLYFLKKHKSLSTSKIIEKIMALYCKQKK